MALARGHVLTGHLAIAYRGGLQADTSLRINLGLKPRRGSATIVPFEQAVTDGQTVQRKSVQQVGMETPEGRHRRVFPRSLWLQGRAITSAAALWPDWLHVL